MTEPDGLPAQGPATLGGVKAFLTITDTADDTRIQLVLDAANSMVRTWPCALPAVGGTWPARVVEGTNMLAGRLFRRRESPAGVAGFGDNGPVYVSRNDPDVAMLLGLGSWSKPQVG